MFKFTAKLLEYQRGEYLGNPYATIKLRSNEIGENAILKYKVDFKRVPDLSEHVDQDITVSVDVQRGQGDVATLRVVAVEV